MQTKFFVPATKGLLTVKSNCNCNNETEKILRVLEKYTFLSTEIEKFSFTVRFFNSFHYNENITSLTYEIFLIWSIVYGSNNSGVFFIDLLQIFRIEIDFGKSYIRIYFTENGWLKGWVYPEFAIVTSINISVKILYIENYLPYIVDA